jgi:type I restriction enzyme S subunit
MNAPWHSVRLGEVLQYRKEFITIDDLTTYKRPRVRLHAQGVVLRDEVVGAVIKTKQQQVCQSGELLVAEIDAKVGGFGMIPEALDGAIVSSHYFLFGVDVGKVSRAFLEYFIHTPAFRDQVEAQGSTNYAAIRPSQVLDYEMPLPPLSEQQRIVTRIEALATLAREAVALRSQAMKERNALARFSLATFTSAPLQPLRELCNQITDGEHATPQRVDDEQVPLVTAKNVRDGHLDLRRTDFVSRETAESCWRRCRPRPGDVLMVCVGATTGRVCRLVDPPDMVIVRSVAMMRPRADVIDPRFLEYALESREVQDQIWNLVKQAAQPCLYINRMERLAIPVPSLAEQSRVVEELDALQSSMTTLAHLQDETASELDALLPAILDRAFKGEL